MDGGGFMVCFWGCRARRCVCLSICDCIRDKVERPLDLNFGYEWRVSEELVSCLLNATCNGAVLWWWRGDDSGWTEFRGSEIYIVAGAIAPMWTPSFCKQLSPSWTLLEVPYYHFESSLQESQPYCPGPVTLLAPLAEGLIDSKSASLRTIGKGLFLRRGV